MASPTIYMDTGNPIIHFIHEINIVCPRCSKKASLKLSSKGKHGRIIYCSHCFYQEKWKDLKVISGHYRVICQDCKEPFDLEVLNHLISVKKIHSSCPICSFSNQFEISNLRAKQNHKGNTINKDSIELWYKEHFKTYVFWAYNIDHLNEIENYVSSDLRKRHGGNYQSMIEKLPQWIGNRKNREGLLKLIHRLKIKT